MNTPERIYNVLLRAYPATFRANYAEAMKVHFRDQLRESRTRRGAIQSLRFWSRMIIDTITASLKLRLEKEKSKGEIMKAKVPSFAFLLVALWLPMIVGVGLFLLNQPKKYMSIARIEISKKASPAQAAYDPYFLQTQFEKIRSGAVLERVVQEIGLERTLARRGTIQGRIGTSAVADLLRRNIELTQSRNTSLMEIRLTAEDASEAAGTINEILEVYRELVGATVNVDVIDRPSRSLRPISPNVPLIVVAGLLMSSLFAFIGATGLRAALTRKANEFAAA